MTGLSSVPESENTKYKRLPGLPGLCCAAFGSDSESSLSASDCSTFRTFLFSYWNSVLPPVPYLLSTSPIVITSTSFTPVLGLFVVLLWSYFFGVKSFRFFIRTSMARGPEMQIFLTSQQPYLCDQPIICRFPRHVNLVSNSHDLIKRAKSVR